MEDPDSAPVEEEPSPLADAADVATPADDGPDDMGGAADVSEDAEPDADDGGVPLSALDGPLLAEAEVAEVAADVAAMSDVALEDGADEDDAGEPETPDTDPDEAPLLLPLEAGPLTSTEEDTA